MEEFIPLVIALLCGWVLIAGFGELWVRITKSHWGKRYFGDEVPKENTREKIITLGLCRGISAFPVILLVWSVEHWQGLGKNISILLPPIIIGAIWVYYKNWKQSSPIEKKTRILIETTFFLSICYVIFFFWENTNLTCIADRGGDLCHTATMASGETLPPTHPWLPPYKAEDYYRGQWYAGGLLARLCNLSLAHNYFSSYALCVAWINSCVLLCAWIITRQKLIATITAWLLVCLGGHFGFITTYLVDTQTPHPQGAGNLVGGVLSSDDHARSQRLNEWGVKIIDLMETESLLMKPNAPINGIACEPYSYSVTLGDWHSWFGGYLILGFIALGITGFCISRAPPNMILSCLILSIATPAIFIFNTWITPLAVISTGITLLLGTIYKPNGIKLLWLSLLFGIITTSIIITPLTNLIHAKQYGDVATLELIATAEKATFTPYVGWLLYAGAASLWVLLAGTSSFMGLKTKRPTILVVSTLITTIITISYLFLHYFFLENVYEGSRLHLGSPIIPAVLVALPCLFVMAAAVSKLKGIELTNTCWLAITAAIIFGCLYGLIETVFVHDYLEKLGPWERDNTSNKWLPSTLFLVTTLAAPIALSAKHIVLKIPAYILAVILIVPSTYGYVTNKRWDGSNFSGTSWIKNSGTRPIYENLLKLEKGVVLEYQHKDLTYATPGGLLPLHTGHKAWIGWIFAHLGVWYPSFEILDMRRQQAIEFYEGKMVNPGQWAKENGIDYIVWSLNLQREYNGPGSWRPFAAPTEEEFSSAWQKNSEGMAPYYVWIETNPPPQKEGLWVNKELLNSRKNVHNN